MLGRMIGTLLCGITLCGCAVHETHKDHDLIRTTLLDLYTNQIMDNLIRAQNRMPIIQIDYNNASTQVTITNNIGGSDSQVTTASNIFALPAASLSATRTVMTTLMGNAGNMNSNQVSLTATPVTTSNDVYEAYRKFLKKDGNLIVSPVKPPPGTAHICKQYDHQFYYVPADRADEFFELAMSTTAERGTATETTDRFFTVTLSDPKTVTDNPDHTGKVVTFNIGQQKLPVDNLGTLTLDSDKSATQFGARHSQRLPTQPSPWIQRRPFMPK